MLSRQHTFDGTQDAAQQFGHLWYPQEGRKSDICRCVVRLLFAFEPLSKTGRGCRVGWNTKCSPMHAGVVGSITVQCCFLTLPCFFSAVASRCKHKFSRMNNDGFKCAACHKRIHTKCTDVADTSACRPSFEKVSPPHFEPEVSKRATLSCCPKISEQYTKPEFLFLCCRQHATIHHWVAGIFEQVKSCDVCKKSVRAVSSIHEILYILSGLADQPSALN